MQKFDENHASEVMLMTELKIKFQHFHTRVKFADTFKRIQYENTLREHFSKIATKMIH